MGNNETVRDLRMREQTVFSTIPGMRELAQASPANIAEIEAQYPDAVFVAGIASSLFNHNRELSEITHCYIVTHFHLSSLRTLGRIIPSKTVKNKT